MNKQKQLDIVRQMIADGVVTQEQAAKYFPELAESENEKILKAIYQYLYNVRHNIGQLTPYTDEFDRWIAWFEKQGEQKPDEEYNITGIHSKHAEGKLGEMIKNLKSAWSEEDEIILNDIMHNIHFAETHRNVTGSSAMEKEQVNWLKSLKDRYTWKPSDEQMNAINDAIDYLGENTKIVRKHLMSLYEQLKKLKA